MSQHITATGLIAAALAAGTIYAVQDPPECETGEPWMLVVDVHVPEQDGEPAHCIRTPVTTICGQPLTLAEPVGGAEVEIPCGDLAPGEVRRVATELAYPSSVVGYVQRDATEDSEAIPIGGPNSTADEPPYYCRRLWRLHPEAPCP